MDSMEEKISIAFLDEIEDLWIENAILIEGLEMIKTWATDTQPDALERLRIIGKISLDALTEARKNGLK